MLNPVIRSFCRAWFSVLILVCFTFCWTGCALITVVPGGRRTKEERAIVLCHYMFRYLLLGPIPWIRVDLPDEEEVIRLLDREKVFLLLNHSSFLDSIAFVAFFPPRVLRRYRTLMKASLFKVPLLGFVSRVVGHFPVYFRSTKDEVFTVEKGKQAEVMKKVEALVDSGGCLSIFPEACVNPNPAVLCPFRRGTFALAKKMSMTVVGLTSVGASASWPKNDLVGGLPTRISYAITEVVGADHGLSAEALRERSQEVMQAGVTMLLDCR
ncbi:unnamed protein product, partial [Discosporangium mesarthrocarpum]